MSRGQRHMITCNCILHQFSKMKDAPNHQFPVFSVINDDDTVNVRFAQCNNCGIVHKVTDLCRSEILYGRESFGALVSIDDVKASLPREIREILAANDADLATYEQAQFIFFEKRWGEHVVLSTDKSDNLRTVKYLRILGESLLKVDTISLDDGF